jgi:hypothetical protein
MVISIIRHRNNNNNNKFIREFHIIVTMMNYRLLVSRMSHPSIVKQPTTVIKKAIEIFLLLNDVRICMRIRQIICISVIISFIFSGFKNWIIEEEKKMNYVTHISDICMRRSLHQCFDYSYLTYVCVYMRTNCCISICSYNNLQQFSLRLAQWWS